MLPSSQRHYFERVSILIPKQWKSIPMMMMVTIYTFQKTLLDRKDEFGLANNFFVHGRSFTRDVERDYAYMNGELKRKKKIHLTAYGSIPVLTDHR